MSKQNSNGLTLDQWVLAARLGSKDGEHPKEPTMDERDGWACDDDPADWALYYARRARR